MTFMRRREPRLVNGLLVVADRHITGIVEAPEGAREITRVVSAGVPTQEWVAGARAAPLDGQADRQMLAIGAAAQAQLAGATIAVVGNSGGGSHVTQQLIHAGLSKLVVIDPDLVEETNLRRLVGAVQADIGVTPKPDIAVRVAELVRPTVEVVPIAEAFPSARTIAALRDADLIVGCVDGWDTRDDLNALALRYRIPYIDIGITVVGATDHAGMRVGGQIALVAPDGPCMRCMGLGTDQRVEASREMRQGYADAEPDPQVVSLNGTVASEAVTTALMLLAGDDRLSRRRRYAYPPGLLIDVEATRRPGCPACGVAGLRSAPPAATAEDDPQPSHPSLVGRVRELLRGIPRRVRTLLPRRRKR
jgi:molybdopterin/thiamine biosynthesis adenylyltransferase